MNAVVRTIFLSVISLGLAINLALAAKPGTEDPGGGFLGFSDAVHGTVNGGVGKAGMDAKCELTYPDVGARMCTSEEVLGSQVTAQTGNAWVHPSYVGVITVNNDWIIRVDASGLHGGNSDSNFSCTGWKRDVAPGSGLSLDANLSFSTNNCATLNQVACCN